MKLLISTAVAAVTAVLAVLAMKYVDGPWNGDDSSLRTALAGALAGISSVFTSRKLRDR